MNDTRASARHRAPRGMRWSLVGTVSAVGVGVATVIALAVAGAIPIHTPESGGSQQEALVAYATDAPDVTGPFAPDDDVPAVRRLDPALLDATRQAFDEAAANGVGLEINSGWRSQAEQQALLDQAVIDHGSVEEALRWVATPETSHHTTGKAIDVGPALNTDWLDTHGYRFGLCRTYDNEAWHFELGTTPGSPCPPRLPSAAEDH